VKEIVISVSDVIKFFRSHHQPMAELRYIVGDLRLGFVNPSLTRWASFHSSFKVVLKHKDALRKIGSQLEDLPRIACNRVHRLIGAQLRLDVFWDELALFLDLIRMPSAMTIILESDQSTLADVVFGFVLLSASLNIQLQANVLPQVNSISVLADVREIIENRWSKLPQPVYLAAFLLHPVYKSLANIVEIRHPVGQFLSAYYLNLFPGKHNECGVMINELNTYIYKTFDDSDPAPCMLPGAYWGVMSGTHELHKIGTRLFSIPPSSAVAERCWSLYSSIHSKSRNHLNTETVHSCAKVAWQAKMERRKGDPKCKVNIFHALKSLVPETVLSSFGASPIRGALEDREDQERLVQSSSNSNFGSHSVPISDLTYITDNDSTIQIPEECSNILGCMEGQEVDQDVPRDALACHGKEDVVAGLDLLSRTDPEEEAEKDLPSDPKGCPLGHFSSSVSRMSLQFLLN
jgi:hypothetical protein